MKEIPLTRGYVAIVDDADYEWLSRHKWHVVGPDRRLYAGRKHMVNGVKTTLFMHVAIMNPPDGMQVDHIDGNQFNCQRANMRNATPQQNTRNKRKSDRNKKASQYKGVRWVEANKKWRAVISVNNKTKHLGMYLYEKAAARAYDDAARKYFGEFACLNFADVEGAA